MKIFDLISKAVTKETIEAESERATLVSIERKGRMNLFTFKRDGEVFTIETMGLLSDNIAAWRKKAGLTE